MHAKIKKVSFQIFSSIVFIFMFLATSWRGPSKQSRKLQSKLHI